MAESFLVGNYLKGHHNHFRGPLSEKHLCQASPWSSKFLKCLQMELAEQVVYGRLLPMGNLILQL